MSEQKPKKEIKWKNGYSDASGKGTITYNNKGVFRVHWGCSCCDGFDENTDKELIKLADKLSKHLNKTSFVLEEKK